MKHAQKLAALLLALTGLAPLAAQSNGMVTVRGGSFKMGSEAGNDDAPVHTVTLSSFSMSRGKITLEEWMSEMGVYPEGYEERSTNTRVPRMKWRTAAASNITWYDALIYCNRRSVSEGLTPCYASNGSKDAITYSGQMRRKFANVSCDWNADGYRLPTEAEWEYAARTGTGLSDMCRGNREWCWDWYSRSYYEASRDSTDPHGPDYGDAIFSSGGSFGGYIPCRVTRGGTNRNAQGEPPYPVHSRGYLNPAEYEIIVGPEVQSFRVVRNVP